MFFWDVVLKFAFNPQKHTFMIRKIFFLSFLFPAFLSLKPQAIVADHNAVEEYTDIPEFYKDKVKTMLLNIVGESHSRGYRYGLQLLEDVDDSYACDIRFSKQNPLEPGTLALRAHAAIRTASSWDNWVGEEDFWTTTWAVDQLKNHLDYCRTTLENPISVIGFAWCYDMTYTYAPQSDYTDPEFGCKWFGGSKCWDGEAFVERGAWGIDATDSAALGGYRVTLQQYLRTIDALRSYSASVAVYTTSPMDGSDNTGERGYQRQIKNNYIREYIADNEMAVLFDYADIVSYNDEGVQQTTTWDDHTFPVIHPDNYGTYNGGEGDCHLSEAGCLRLGKALWWMLARIAGWQSEPVNRLAMAGNEDLRIFRLSGTIEIHLPRGWHNTPISVYSATGQCIYSTLLNGPVSTLNTNCWKPGVYVIQVGALLPRKMVWY